MDLDMYDRLSMVPQNPIFVTMINKIVPKYYC